MKITLMEAVMANLAAEEVGRQAVPYSLALALMKVKQATAAEAETFAAEERKLVEKFAAKDEDGNIRVAQGRFTFRAPGERGEYSFAAFADVCYHVPDVKSWVAKAVKKLRCVPRKAAYPMPQ